MTELFPLECIVTFVTLKKRCSRMGCACSGMGEKGNNYIRCRKVNNAPCVTAILEPIFMASTILGVSRPITRHDIQCQVSPPQ